MCELIASLQVVQLIFIFNIITFKIENTQMLNKADVEKFINLIISYVQLLELFKCLYTLNFFKFTSSKMQDSNIFEWCSDITKAWNNRIIQLQEFKTRKNLTSNLQIMKTSIHSELNFRKQSKISLIDPKLLR